MTYEYKPNIYTNNYINEKNILSLCYKNILNEYIENNIKTYLIEYDIGFYKFNNNISITQLIFYN